MAKQPGAKMNVLLDKSLIRERKDAYVGSLGTILVLHGVGLPGYSQLSLPRKVKVKKCTLEQHHHKKR